MASFDPVAEYDRYEHRMELLEQQLACAPHRECAYCVLPSRDGIQGLDDAIGYCTLYGEFYRPDRTAAEDGCDGVVIL